MWRESKPRLWLNTRLDRKGFRETCAEIKPAMDTQMDNGLRGPKEPFLASY